MEQSGPSISTYGVENHGLHDVEIVHWNYSTPFLYEAALRRHEGVLSIDGVDHQVKDDDGVIVPQGARHNVRATGDRPLKLYTIYGPPEHIDGTVHKTCDDARAAHEHFDGKTTE